MTCKQCERLQSEIKRLRGMLDHSVAQEARHASDVGRLRPDDTNQQKGNPMIGDEELRRIFYNAFNAPGNSILMAVRAVRESVTADWESERDAATIRLDATKHALEISEAQREELRETLAAANREVAEHRKHISIIMSRESEAQGELLKAKRTLHRAVVEVPEGVPSALELTHEWMMGGTDGVPPIQFALDRLAPFLQPSASVDPKICEKDSEFPCVFSRNDELTLSDAHLENCTVGTNTKDGRALVDLSPADAHRAGMWMLSFAASQGIDVRLPVVDPQCHVPRAELDAMREERDRLADQIQPPIPAETLDQLAEIACRAENADDISEDSWSYSPGWQKEGYRRSVAAILRAARPYCDLNVGSVAEWVGFDSAVDVLNKIDSRIRYTVEVPPAECPTCAKVKEAIGVRDE